MRENKRQGGGVALKAVGMSDIGKCRKNNEDAYYISAGEKLYVAYVGDSRAYLFRKKEMQPLTTDHSYVMELVKMGSITKEEAAMHPKRNVITRAIGIRDTVETDTVIHPVQKGDIVLLCTDGLSGMLKDEEMAKILSKRIALDKKAAILVEEANRQGGHDNISLILVEI